MVIIRFTHLSLAADAWRSAFALKTEAPLIDDMDDFPLRLGHTPAPLIALCSRISGCAM
jgi:hypothetical protein